ncbi:MAG: glycosyltransferase [Ignavibacteria bacterium]|nr:glycosyltransferase [Ignavibacteria bacterium]
MKKKASLIISVYKKIRELELILNALKIQTFKDFEILIADDGSGVELSKFISDFKKTSDLDITHVFQNDSGFRKNRILNKAIKKSNYNYLIFIDGDCVPHSDFIRQHLLYMKNNTVLCGRRVNLSKSLSDRISIDRIINKDYEKIRLKHVLDSWKKNDRSTFVEEGLLIRNKILRKLFSKKEVHIVGCNFSLNKQLIEKINGFDENYIGPGFGEDSDIELRLRLAGAEFFSVKNLAVIFHMYHGITKASSKNASYYMKALKNTDYVCKSGLVNLNSG